MVLSAVPAVEHVAVHTRRCVSLFDVSWGGHSENWGGIRTSRGTLRPSEAVLGLRDGPLADSLEIEQLHSRLDGLTIWGHSPAITHAVERDENGRSQSATYTLRGRELAQWNSGGLVASLSSSWGTESVGDAQGDRTVLDDYIFLKTDAADGPVSFWEHFVEQRKIASLLVFAFGRAIGFREHRLRDSRFVARMNGGAVYDHPRHQVVSRHSIRDRELPVLTREQLGRPMAYLPQIGSEGLAAWSEAYERWRRFILPAAAVLGRQRPFVKDVVTSTSMAIEAAGGLIGPQAGEEQFWNGRGRRPTYVSVYRCLKYLDLDLSDIGERVDIAAAIANNYNDVKHFDRGDFPDSDQTYLVSRLNRLIVRMVALSLTGRGDELMVPIRDSVDVLDVKQLFHANHMQVGAEGAWQSTET